ncbi:hypothetical protein Rsub_04182 [Raphidocelis subcapitata]|uniref:U-box domain-containing protein n=1 Tax=Raphidocelis subcapitata TaxID=307507 RepID=A0A2V0NXP1_9CHLO|nr:hypothetical protein Rsub_04182 [Raphidocelis subcapitata]|eukprot:GBF91442.1 hypothetical protein Rsub_04182 [Raphidocelis subcapitata]
MEFAFSGGGGGGGGGARRGVRLDFVLGADGHAAGRRGAQQQCWHVQRAAARTHAAPQPGHAGASAAAPRLRLPSLPQLPSPGLPCSWRALAAAGLVGANVLALAWLARRAWLDAAARRAAADAAEAAEARADGEQEQIEVTRAALNYMQRLWDLAMQVDPGPPKDIGEPDAEGVYTATDPRTGARLHFRCRPRPGPDGARAPPAWEWSTSGRLWLPTSAADSIWCDSGDCSSPGLSGRLLIRRLELEAQLAAGRAAVRRAASAEPFGALPPLELPDLPPFKPAPRNGRSARRGPGAAAVAVAAAAAEGLGPLDGGLLGADIPECFLCPLTYNVMTDPVTTPGGITYQRDALVAWIRRHGTDPVTGHALAESQPYPNINLRDQIIGHFLVRQSLRDAP